MPIQATKITLPSVLITKVTDKSDLSARQVDITSKNHKSFDSYYVKSRKLPHFEERTNASEISNDLKIPTFPLVVNKAGVPWAEANIWLLTLYLGRARPKISSVISIAADLIDFLKFIEESEIDWLQFDCEKIFRPTYRFNAHLSILVQADPKKSKTSKRKMGTIIRFYRWLQNECGFVPKRKPWIDKDTYVETTTYYGETLLKTVTTTDISIKVNQQDDPYDERILDGEKLKPLTQEEQKWLLEALTSVGNTEMTLIHLFSIFTGARIQTILTFRIRDVTKDIQWDSQGYIRIPVGDGTGIDTKFGKRQVLHLPYWLYEKLRTYAFSERAKKRRLKASGGDVPLQYLFLSIKGAPFYQATNLLPGPNPTNLRHSKSGQAVRQFISEEILPYVRQNFSSKFHYQFHDLRATFGMNMVDDRMKLVNEKKMTLDELYELVRVRMSHTNFKTTESYINYRSNLAIARSVQDGWEATIEKMARVAMGGSNE